MKEPTLSTQAEKNSGHWLSRYRKSWLVPDVLAGLTASAVVIPKAMAFATIAGLPVEIGLYTMFLAMIAYALTGSSRALSVSTTTTLAIMAAAQLSGLPGADSADGRLHMASMLALLVGAWLVVGSFLRLGFLANFISEPVLIGFKGGIAIVIVVDQLPKLLGIHIERGFFHENLISIFKELPGYSGPTVAVAVSALALILALEHLAPKLPAPLVAVAASIAASWALDLNSRGVHVAGAVPTGLPAFTPPDLSLIGPLWVGALGIALMSFTESVAAARAFTKSDDPRLEPNRELLGLGLANFAAGFFSGMPAGGGTTQTAVNDQAGARTQMAELVTAAVAVAALLFLGPLIGLLPQCTLAAVVVATSIPLLRPADFARMHTARSREFRWAMISLLGVVLLGTLQGIMVAVVVSLMSLVSRSQDLPVQVLGRKPETDVFRPTSDEHPEDETFPGLLLVRPVGMVYFANATRVVDKIQAALGDPMPRVVVLDCSAVPDIEYTGLKVLGELKRRLEGQGSQLWVTALNPDVLEVLRRMEPENLRMHFNLTQAVEAYQQLDLRPQA